MFLIRGLLVGFMVGLVVSGVTAFALPQELSWLVRQTGVSHGWLVQVRDALAATDAKYPFLAYGTDWLALAHIVIAVLFIGPYRDPMRNVWVVEWGMVACVLVVPLALVCGPVRGIPFAWRLVDCSFGVVGIVPLLICRRFIKRLEVAGTR